MSFYSVSKSGLAPLHEAAENTAVEKINDGELLLYRQGLQKLGFFAPIHEAIFACTAKHVNDNTLNELRKNGIEHIHEYLSGAQLIAVYHEMREILAKTMPYYVKEICRQLLGINRCYIHANSLIRIIVPHKILCDNLNEFSKHLGKLDLHGPHHDFYQDVAFGSINLWIAIGPVHEANGMSIFTDVWGKTLPKGKDHVAADQYLGEPVNIVCEPGDILMFHNHHMHASVLNSTQSSRIVLTNRFTVETPVHPNPANMMTYVDSSQIVENIRPDSTIPHGRDTVKIVTQYYSRTKESVEGWSQKLPSELNDNEITAINQERCAVKIDGKIHFIARYCTHIGADLSLGYVKDGKIHCPWHNLPFDPETGRSACDAIRPLKTFT